MVANSLVTLTTGSLTGVQLYEGGTHLSVQFTDSTQNVPADYYWPGQTSFDGVLAPSKAPCNLTYDDTTHSSKFYTPGSYNVAFSTEPAYRQVKDSNEKKPFGFWLMCEVTKDK